jgi:hypothetical protein
MLKYFPENNLKLTPLKRKTKKEGKYGRKREIQNERKKIIKRREIN